MNINISVVIPIYNEEGNIVPLIEELLPIVDKVGGGEIIIVNDNSNDSSKDLVLNNNQEGSLFYQQYIDLGLYHQQVKSYIDEFGSTNVCVMFYEDLKKDRATFVNNIFSFLNLKSDSNINFNLKYNKSKLPSNNFMRYLYSISLVRKTASFLFNERLINFINKNFFRESNQEIESKVRHKLNQVFLNDIFMLEKLLNKDLSSWRK